VKWDRVEVYASPPKLLCDKLRRTDSKRERGEVHAPIGVRPLQVARHLHFEDFTKYRKTADVVVRNFTPHPRPQPE